jgi:hypothetical protein
MSAGEFNGCLDPLAPGTGEKYLGEPTAGAHAERLAELAGEIRYMALQHRRPLAIELALERLDQRGVVVAQIVYAIPREKIENDAAVARLKLCAAAPCISDVHLQHVEQPAPLRIDVLVIGAAVLRLGAYSL